jgi:hypothetical protein
MSTFLIVLVIIIAVVIWGLTRRKSSSSPDDGNRSEFSGATSLPSLKIIRASDTSGYSDKLQIICQNLKMESRINPHFSPGNLVAGKASGKWRRKRT